MSETKTPSEILDKLQSEPLHLAQVIVWNNPREFSTRLSAITGVDPDMTKEEALDLAYGYISGLSQKDIYHLFNVPFNEEADNNTSTYRDVLLLRMEQIEKQSGRAPLQMNWADLFPNTVYGIQEAYMDFTSGMGGPAQTDQNVNPDAPKGSKSPCGCQLCQYRKRILTYAGIGLGLLLLLFIVRKW